MTPQPDTPQDDSKGIVFVLTAAVLVLFVGITAVAAVLRMLIVDAWQGLRP